MHPRSVAKLTMLGALLFTTLGERHLIPMENAEAATMASSSKAKANIEKTIALYGAALNGGLTASVLPLYTEDGVFMAPYSHSHIGKGAIASAYDGVFRELKFDVKFDIVEIIEISPGWAFVRTNSAGTTLHRTTGQTTSEANQELFILEKGSDGIWRIARYSFSSTNPPSS